MIINFLYYGIVYIIEAAILFLYCHKLFAQKRSVLITLTRYIISFMILIPIAIYCKSWLNGIAFTLIEFIIIYTLYNTSFFNALFHSIILTIVMSLSELVIAMIFPMLTYDYARNIDIISSNIIITAIITKFLYFFIIQIICLIITSHNNRYESQLLNTINTIISLLISVICLTITFIICHIIEVSSFNKQTAQTFAIILIMFFIINFIVYANQQYNQQKSYEFSQLQSQLQKEYDYVEYYKMLAKESEAQNILIHDIKNHLQVISTLNNNNQNDKINNYINCITESSALKTYNRFSDNDILNALLYRYSTICNDKNIKFITDIRSKTLNNISDNDCTALFGNLMDNAYEAGSLVSNAQIELTIIAVENSEYTLIKLLNSCRSNPFTRDNKLITTKNDKKHHGYGLKSIYKIVNKYEGHIEQYYSDDNIFHTVITIKNISTH